MTDSAMLAHATYLLESDDYFQRDGEMLLVGGRDVETLADVAGQTPLFAYDRRVAERRVATLRAALPKIIELHYAIKANPMPAMIELFRPLVEGFDVASQRELIAALNTGMPVSEISFAGPSKRDEELIAAAASGICTNAESESEIDRLEAIGRRLGVEPRVAVRVNPAFELKGAGMKMGGSPRQFGIDAERVPELLKTLRDRHLTFAGLHIFGGSQNLDPEAIADCQEKTFELAASLLTDVDLTAEFVNIGGGFGIPYFPGDAPLDVAAVGARLAPLAERFRSRFPDTKLVMELGRFLVGECGVYVTRVVDVKVSRGVRFAMTDGGLHHHLANSGNFGQVIRKNYPVVVANRLGHPVCEDKQMVVGPLCTPLDIVADKLPLPAIEVGDLIAVFQSGAYGYTASPRDFLSHPDAVQMVV